ncbi:MULTISPECIES: hypothetical protein [Bacteroidales]|uniref:hypothetical protein n=1 Tax=Bacteroidales TaxID=171549 RepID=UPI002623D449|nr:MULTISPECIES: hypothetical protein [Bacteroidales]
MNKESKMARSVALLRQRRRRLKDGRCRYALKTSEIPDDLLEAWIIKGEFPLDERTGEADLNDERCVPYLLFLHAYETYYGEKIPVTEDSKKAFCVFCDEQAILRTVYWARMSEYPLPEMEIFDFDRYGTILLRLLRALPDGMWNETAFS